MSPLESIGRSGTVDDGPDTTVIQAPYSSEPLLADKLSLLDKQESDTDNIESRDTSQSPVSQASTLRFEYCGHVPYSQFETQVQELCHVLWPAFDEEATEKPLVEYIRQRLVVALGLSDPSSSLLIVPTSKEFVIEHLRGGSFNRVVGVTTIEKDLPNSRMVLKVPRGDMAEPEHDVTILLFVQEYASMIPLPEVISYDLTRDNPLNAPYVLQKRVSGLDLESKTRSYLDLTQDQKIMFVEEFCQILVDLQGIEHPYAGRIDTRVDAKGTKEFTVGPFVYGPESDELVAKRSASMPFFKIRKFGDETTSEDAPKDLGSTDRLVSAAIQMNEMGFLDPFKDEAHSFCLTHYDLDPRNIMVDVEEDGTLKISGILDWDLAMFAPKGVHCRPPMWIWNWLDGGNEDQRKANDMPPTEEQQELKELFEDLVGWEFKHRAYHTAYRLARTLFRLALYGYQSDHAIKDAEKLLEDEDEYYQSRQPNDVEREDKQGSEVGEDTDDEDTVPQV